MESNHNAGAGRTTISGGAPANARWNPTKEQISMLENLYRQGIRTPSAEQIQQITARLKAYGHIEGKNVFYWFQNHKARQRQKQRQESLAYFNHFLHRPDHPIFSQPPSCPNVLCGSYDIPQAEMGPYPQCPKVLLPGGVRRSSMATENVMMPLINYDVSGHEDMNKPSQETMDLFPLHPTGILEGKSGTTRRQEYSFSVASISANSSAATTPSGSSEIDELETTPQPFFDFFSGQLGSCDDDN